MERGETDLVDATFGTIAFEIRAHKWDVQDPDNLPVLDRLAGLMDQARAGARQRATSRPPPSWSPNTVRSTEARRRSSNEVSIDQTGLGSRFDCARRTRRLRLTGAGETRPRQPPGDRRCRSPASRCGSPSSPIRTRTSCSRASNRSPTISRARSGGRSRPSPRPTTPASSRP